eukprot:3746356-Rhodomonas_salina.1
MCGVRCAVCGVRCAMCDVRCAMCAALSWRGGAWQASYNQITELPSQVRLVEHLELLDISYNRLTELPISELKMML